MSDPVGPWWQQRKWRAVIAVGFTYAVTVFTATMAFVLLPEIAEHFDVTLRVVGWVVIVQALVISSLLLPLGRFADAWGRRRALVLGVALFAVGNLATGLAPGFGFLIGARTVAAVGDAMTQAVGTAALVAAFPSHERGLAVGAQTTAVAFGAASGPVLTGWALGVVGWQVPFFVIAGMASLAAIAAWVFLDGEATVTASRRVDPGGVLLSASAIVAMTVAISDPFDVGVGSPISIGLVVVAVLATVGFVRWELRRAEPMLDVRLFAIRTFHTAAAVRVLAFSAATTWTLLLPIYLLTVRGISSTWAGVVIATTAIGMAVGAQLGGRVYDRYGAKTPAMAGLGAQAVLLVWLAGLGVDSSIVVIGAVMLAAGIAQSLWNVPNNSALMGSPPPESLGVVGAFSNINRTIGNVIGQALAAAIVTAVLRRDDLDVPLSDLDTVPGAIPSFLDGWRWAFGVAAALSVVAVVVASRLPSGDGD